MSEDNSQWLNRIEGVDTEDGIRYTGSEEAYLKFLRTFVRTLDDKSKEIEDSYNNGDMEFCTIKVHALKSTARIIGAKELSKLAEKLEGAGHHNDMETFDAGIGELLELYRSYKEKLKELPTQTEIIHREPISEGALKEAYEALRSFVSQMDYEAVRMILDELSMYILPKEDEELVETLGRKVLIFDWEGMKNLLY
jgi:HPt (histidine-containing phosphotransfer) domain-containing protein